MSVMPLLGAGNVLAEISEPTKMECDDRDADKMLSSNDEMVIRSRAVPRQMPERSWNPITPGFLCLPNLCYTCALRHAVHIHRLEQSSATIKYTIAISLYIKALVQQATSLSEIRRSGARWLECHLAARDSLCIRQPAEHNLG